MTLTKTNFHIQSFSELLLTDWIKHSSKGEMLLRAKSEQMPYKECGTILIPFYGEVLGSDILHDLKKVSEMVTDKDVRNFMSNTKKTIPCLQTL